MEGYHATLPTATNIASRDLHGTKRKIESLEYPGERHTDTRQKRLRHAHSERDETGFTQAIATLATESLSPTIVSDRSRTVSVAIAATEKDTPWVDPPGNSEEPTHTSKSMCTALSYNAKNPEYVLESSSALSTAVSAPEAQTASRQATSEVTAKLFTLLFNTHSSPQDLLDFIKTFWNRGKAKFIAELDDAYDRTDKVLATWLEVQCAFVKFQAELPLEDYRALLAMNEFSASQWKWTKMRDIVGFDPDNTLVGAFRLITELDFDFRVGLGKMEKMQCDYLDEMKIRVMDGTEICARDSNARSRSVFGKMWQYMAGAVYSSVAEELSD
ncbi:hypothetical protein HBH98_254040 [Parastagonospora nodorum]|nr:hypothetical protein HBH53_263560 [Parastagonospora nodorum]KAH3956005.1 hypothetical protein HBH51_258460 [Parastagonospora nodorum]KAH4215282.1 hypothetical protein HBI06_257770 [Parastagonospora nodorum]KAH4221318.1 hypothetical protein HBI05_255980 [Parastagonospora nodorum]KAH4332125.1 hypothetical protein HBH98_254040 [Parastagonospora nodorum]